MSMQLLRSSEVEIRLNDHVYRQSQLSALVVVGVVLGSVAWLVYHAVTTGGKPGYYIAGVIALILYFLRRFVTARFRPSNWLVRMNDEGIFIQFRSYLNYHLPAEDITVVFVPFGEIRSSRLVKERVTTPDPQGHGGQTRYLRYIELELVGDTVALASALEAEETERPPSEKRWYGTSSTLYEDYPVRMETPPFLRIKWQAVPGTGKFLDALRPYTTIADPVSLKQDFAHLGSRSRDEQQQILRELVARGETIAAVYTARKLYGCGLGEAEEMVEGLKSRKTAGM